MSEAALAAGSSPAPKGLLTRFIGIIFSPKETFESLVAHPRWLGMLVLVAVVASAGASALLMTEKGRQLALDAQVSQMESFGMTINDRMYDQMQQGMERGAYFAGAWALIATPIVYTILAGILLGIFNAALGGQARFKQVLAVVAHSGVVTVISQAFNLPLAYLRGALTGASNLGALLPILDEKSFLAHLLGAIDLFWVWWILVLSTGLAVLYRRRTQSIAVTLFAIYAVFAVVIALVKSRLGG